MVRITKVYTKFGDKGRTMLGDGATVPKHSLRVSAYGTVDEANAAVGVVVADLVRRLSEPTPPVPPDPRSRAHFESIKTELLLIQHDLFDAGADLCVPVAAGEAPGAKLRVQPAQSQRLEALIDRFNEPLGALTSFILPGGDTVAAHLHLARTITRRAERLVSELLTVEPGATNAESLIYLNRLSDLLFVLARSVNRVTGAGDTLWKPGHNR